MRDLIVLEPRKSFTFKFTMNQNQLELDCAHFARGSRVPKHMFDSLGLVDFAFRFSRFSPALPQRASEVS